jgi:lipopolysaccharide/colanic/teichoic acid biosynthesis glycosyltransferase
MSSKVLKTPSYELTINRNGPAAACMTPRAANLPLLSRKARLFKRFLDLLLGLPLFLVSLPLVGALALVVKLVSRGPAFFVQEREGLNGTKIKVWKLRTMYPDAERRLEEYLARHPLALQEWQRSCKLKHDPRVLPVVGSVLRRTSMDELPQLWNVLRGEMTLVGPRPFPDYHLSRFPEEFRRLRRSVVPGLTGLWQVEARSDGDLKAQMHWDRAYIENWSVWLDLRILAKTVWVVFTGKGAC